MWTTEVIKEHLANHIELEHLAHPMIDMQRKLLEDILEQDEDKREEYIQEQISTMEAVAGIMIPLENANFAIKYYKRVLEGDSDEK